MHNKTVKKTESISLILGCPIIRVVFLLIFYFIYFVNTLQYLINNVPSLPSHNLPPSIGQGLDPSLPEGLGLRFDPLREGPLEGISVGELLSSTEVRDRSEAVVITRADVWGVRWMGQRLDVQLLLLLLGHFCVVGSRVVHE